MHTAPPRILSSYGADCLTEPHFEQQLASGIGELERRPAHLTRPQKIPAWMPGSKATPITAAQNAAFRITYKGELLGIILDLAVRDASHGHTSLREVFQWMNENYAKKGRVFPRFRRRAPGRPKPWPSGSRLVFHKVRSRHRRDSLERFLPFCGTACDRGKEHSGGCGIGSPRRNFDGPMDRLGSGRGRRAPSEPGCR